MRCAFSTSPGGPVWIAVLLIGFIFWGTAWWRIFSKAGYGTAFRVLGVVLMFFPLTSVIPMAVLAFGAWPQRPPSSRAGR